MISQKRIKEIKEEFGYDFTKMSWKEISIHKGLCENFIDKYINKVDWFRISMYQKLSEDFINEHVDEVDWDYISIYQKLSEDFIDKHTDKVDWNYISMYQKLSEDFIEKHADKVNWYCISKYQVITPEFADEHNISINNNSQRTAAEWKKMIEETNLYECHEDYFYAYKSIRGDRYSHFNFQYQYLPGESYDCFSDYSDNENSFGLSAWTEKEAHDYSDKGMVVKLKVNYADVTAIVHDSNKIRCKRITVLD